MYNIEEFEKTDVLGIKKNRKVLTSVVEQVVRQGNWFTFCTKLSDEQKDLSKLRADDEDVSRTLGNLMASDYSETLYRSAVFKHLLKNYLCYYEVPTIRKDFKGGGESRKSFDKLIITSNLGVVARWLNIGIHECMMKYGSRLDDTEIDNETDFFPYLKLYVSKKGEMKVSKTQKDLDLGIKGTRVVPLFTLMAGVDTLYEMGKEDTLQVNFIKDSGEPREMVTTFQDKRVLELYDSNTYDEFINTSYNGTFLGTESILRGFIRVIELGASKYSTPMRSINYARILSLKKGVEPDLAFLNIDTSIAVEEFKEGLLNLSRDEVDLVADMLEIMEIGKKRVFSKGFGLSDILSDWADTQKIILGSIFERSLSLFMLGNPTLFPKYDGKPKDTYSCTGTENYGLL